MFSFLTDMNNVQIVESKEPAQFEIQNLSAKHRILEKKKKSVWILSDLVHWWDIEKIIGTIM